MEGERHRGRVKEGDRERCRVLAGGGEKDREEMKGDEDGESTAVIKERNGEKKEQ